MKSKISNLRSKAAVISFNKTNYSDSSIRSTKKSRRQDPEEEFASRIVKLPKTNPLEKGPKITYSDALSYDQIDRLRKESTNRINSRKARELEYKRMLKLRRDKYGTNNIRLNPNLPPDFENQLPTSFHLKYRRADQLGVRGLYVDEDDVVRASRPNMDKMTFFEH